MLRERFSQAAMLVPGILENPDRTLTIKWTRPDQQKLLVTSANLDDPVTGDPAFHQLSDAVQSAQALTNPYDPEYFMRKNRTTRAGVKIFNVTNHFNPRDVQDNISSPTFGRFYNSVGRLYRAKLELNF